MRWKRSSGLMLRNYQILWKEKTFFEEAKWIKDLMITVISKNPETNKLLTYFETPSHLLFNESGFTGDLEYDVPNAKLFLRLFRRVANKLINLIFEEEEVENKTYLLDFLVLIVLKRAIKKLERKKKRIIILMKMMLSFQPLIHQKNHQSQGYLKWSRITEKCS